MKTQTSLIEPLLERAELYGKTSVELLKLQALNKTADIMSSVISRLLLIIVVVIFAVSLNIAVGLWVGGLMGRNYYGFLLVAAFYGLLGLGLLCIHPYIKSKVGNSIITQVLN